MDVPKPETDVRLAVKSHGRAPARYGQNAYKFGRQATRLLKSRGWREVGRGSKYAYLRSSSSSPPQPPFEVEAKIPSRDQILALATQLNDAGEKWLGRVGEWDAGYRPANNDEFSWTSQEVDPFTATRIGSPVHKTSQYNINPLFLIGTQDTWSATVKWKNGRAEYTEDTQYVISWRPDLFSQLHSQSKDTTVLVAKGTYEGALQRITTNRYERSQAARSACIAHYGPICSICEFDFGYVYGEIARGFIHVHHIAPVSSISAEYQVDPINDLVPVCPNCHVVLHLCDPPFTVAEVRTFLQSQQIAMETTAAEQGAEHDRELPR